MFPRSLPSRLETPTTRDPRGVVTRVATEVQRDWDDPGTRTGGRETGELCVGTRKTGLGADREGVFRTGSGGDRYAVGE